MNHYSIEITDTFGGEANYSWVKREQFSMPELTHYGYDGGTNYVKANKIFRRELVRKAKAIAGWTGRRCDVDHHGDFVTIKPKGAALVAFVDYVEEY